MIINVIDAVCGSGKTDKLIKQTLSNLDREFPTIIVGKTVKFLDEFRERLCQRRENVRVVPIHRETFPNVSVKAKIIDHLTRSDLLPHVLLITWAAFSDLPFFANKGSWRLIIDEVPQVYDPKELKIPETQSLLTDHIVFSACDLHPDYGCLQAGPGLKKIAENKSDDEIHKVLQKTAIKILNSNWKSYCKNLDYDQSDLKSKSRINVCSFLRPELLEGFSSVTIAGAYFKESLLYLIWTKLGVKFKFMDGMPQTHKCSDRVSIFYVLDDPWSQTKRDRHPEFVTKTIEAIKWEIGNERILLSTNITSEPDDAKAFGTCVTSLPFVSHGLNSFRDYNNVACLGAFNINAQQTNALSDLFGIDKDGVRKAIQVSTTYQAIMRCSIRNAGFNGCNKIFVMDRETADWLHKNLEGSQLKRLQVNYDLSSFTKKPGKPRIYANNAEKVAAYRRKRKLEKESPPKLQESSTESLQTLFLDTCNDILLYKEEMVTGPYGSIWGSLDENKICKEMNFNDVDAFESYLEESSKRKIPGKHDIELISPATFKEPEPGKPKRTQECFKYARVIILDVDEGSIHPNEFGNLFPKVRMLICNTHSSTEIQHRYRVYMVVDGVIAKVSDYKLLMNYMTNKIMEAGFPLKKLIEGNSRKAHGIDTSKFNPVSIFYLPCQAEDPSGNFFKVWKEGRELLDVEEWLDRARVWQASQKPKPYSVPRSASGQVDSGKIERALERWHREGTKPGRGNKELLILGDKLIQAGLDEHGVDERLIEAAKSANSPADRLRQVPRLMERFRKEGRWSAAIAD